MIRKTVANRKSIGKQMLYYGNGEKSYDINPDYIKKPKEKKNKLTELQKIRRVKKIARKSRMYNLLKKK